MNKNYIYLAVFVVVAAAVYLIYVNSTGGSITDPTNTTVSHSGSGSTLLCLIVPKACIPKP